MAAALGCLLLGQTSRAAAALPLPLPVSPPSAGESSAATSALATADSAAASAAATVASTVGHASEAGAPSPGPAQTAPGRTLPATSTPHAVAAPKPEQANARQAAAAASTPAPHTGLVQRALHVTSSPRGAHLRGGPVAAVTRATPRVLRTGGAIVRSPGTAVAGNVGAVAGNVGRIAQVPPSAGRDARADTLGGLTGTAATVLIGATGAVDRVASGDARGAIGALTGALLATVERTLGPVGAGAPQPALGGPQGIGASGPRPVVPTPAATDAVAVLGEAAPRTASSAYAAVRSTRLAPICTPFTACDGIASASRRSSVLAIGGVAILRPVPAHARGPTGAPLSRAAHSAPAGGASPSVAASSGAGTSIFLLLMGLLALAAPWAVRRLRLASEPRRPAPLVLIPERPG